MILRTARKAARIGEGILKARSPRLSEIARGMSGNEAANYKAIQRFLEQTDPRDGLAAIISGGGVLRDRRSDRDAATAGEENGICRRH